MLRRALNLFSNTSLSQAQNNQPNYIDETMRLFKLEDKNGREFYLVGSMHGGSLDFVKAASFEPLKLLNHVESVYCEVNFDDGDCDGPINTLLNENSTSESRIDSDITMHLDAKTSQILIDLIAQWAPTRIFEIKRLPLTKFANAAECALRFSWTNESTSPIGMDRNLHHEAKKLNKRTGGLEDDTRTRQYESYTDEEAIRMLDRLVRQHWSLKITAPIRTLFKKFDENMFAFSEVQERYLNGKVSIPEEVRDKNLLVRNQHMFEKIGQVISREKALFVVGLAHLHGPDGLLQMFRDNGCKVSSIPDRKGTEAIETLQRQIKPALMSASFFMLAMLPINKKSPLLGGICAALFGRTLVGIYERTSFLSLEDRPENLKQDKKPATLTM